MSNGKSGSAREAYFKMRGGADGAASWAIAASCCFINTMLFGMTRLSGVLFVASMPRYGVDREEASFPYTFANFVRNTSGPFIGYLGHKLGVRVVTTCGCFLAAIGVGTCFLAESTNTIILLWGAIYGLGFGLGSILLPVKINQYFDKYRATATGISFSGACLGSFVLPSVVEILVDTYGLSGTFLILAGLVLNCVPAALLLRNPDFTVKFSSQPRRQNLEDERQRIISGTKVKLYTVEDGRDLSTITTGDSHSRKFANSGPIDNRSLIGEKRIKSLSTQTLLSNYSKRMSSPDPLGYENALQDSKEGPQAFLDCEISNVESYKSDQDSEFYQNKKEGNVKKSEPNPFSWRLSNDSSVPFPSKSTSLQYSTSLVDGSTSSYRLKSIHSKKSNDQYVNNSNPPKLGVDSCIKKCSVSSQPPSSERSVFSIVYDPIFVLIAITNAVYNLTFVCMLTVIVDFARDIGVGDTNEKYVLMSLSVGDFVGRLGLGWLTDDGYMTRTGFAALCFLCQGLATTAIAWSTGFVTLVVLAALYGLSEAGLIIIFPLIVAEFVDKDKQTVAIPSASFLAGPLCLTVAPLIGYFRDDIGSYKYIFYGIGLISVICSFAWFLTTCIVKFRRSARKVIPH